MQSLCAKRAVHAVPRNPRAAAVEVRRARSRQGPLRSPPRPRPRIPGSCGSTILPRETGSEQIDGERLAGEPSPAVPDGHTRREARETIAKRDPGAGTARKKTYVARTKVFFASPRSRRFRKIGQLCRGHGRSQQAELNGRDLHDFDRPITRKTSTPPAKPHQAIRNQELPKLPRELPPLPAGRGLRVSPLTSNVGRDRGRISRAADRGEALGRLYEAEPAWIASAAEIANPTFVPLAALPAAPRSAASERRRRDDRNPHDVACAVNPTMRRSSEAPPRSARRSPAARRKPTRAHEEKPRKTAPGSRGQAKWTNRPQ